MYVGVSVHKMRQELNERDYLETPKENVNCNKDHVRHSYQEITILSASLGAEEILRQVECIEISSTNFQYFENVMPENIKKVRRVKIPKIGKR